MGKKFKYHSWSDLYEAESPHKKAELLQDTIMNFLKFHIPEKFQKFSSEDCDYFTPELKKLDRQRKRVYSKQGQSLKWKVINKSFKIKLKSTKHSYFVRMINDLKLSNPKQWFSKMKRTMADNTEFSSDIFVDEMPQLSDKDPDQAEILANHFSSVSQENEALKSSDIV